ncbi:DoxX family membrane protein [Sinomonas sp. JGH33]|uniref:DoxX family membrane protein n=1 Tax=Sinomonas terricola TaxID=3110330 RepID=A0ABU5T9G2_9MICC|nr:DoxX family membrane protein [Sinomonas sp. JGH33]MEA5456330.1 DoxX family membrane protein [Sinomonas sp. JGH33]
MGFTPSHAILRLATGAYMINSGVSKLSLDEESAEAIQNMAANAIPQVKQIPAATFGKALAASEIALGSALVLPFVPTKLAALGLTAFGVGLVATYAKTPGLTHADGVRPTPAGVAMAKDSWLAAIGLALLVDRKRRKDPKPAKPVKA